MTGPVGVPVLPAARVMDAAAATALVGTTVPAVPATVDSPGIWTDAETGETVLAYLPTPEPAALRNIVTRRVSWATTRRSSGMVNTSRTFGYSPRKPFQQRDSCTMSSLNRDDPDAGAYLALYAEKLAAMIGGFAPEILAADAATIEAVRPEWRLTDDALWTSGVINKSSALPYHRDAANFNAWSAMPVVRRGVRGGHLHVPEYGLTVSCRDGMAVFFNGSQLVHGVTPMRALTPDSYRVSIVYYALRGMKDCHTVAEETRLGRAKRTAREVAP